MNNDLISREVLKEAILTHDKFACLPDTRLVSFRNLVDPDDNFVPYVKLDGILNAIDNAPTVETSKIEHKAYNEGFKDGVDQGIKLSEKPQGKRAEGALLIIDRLYIEGHISNTEQGILRRAILLPEKGGAE